MIAVDRPVRLLASDVDGTLLRSDGTVSERTREALAAARAAGLIVVFISGRPPRWLDEIADATGYEGIAIGANGAVRYDPARRQVLVQRVLEPAQLISLAHRLRAAFPRMVFAAEYCEAFGAEQRYVHDWQISPTVDRNGRPHSPPLIGSLAEILAQPAVKLLGKDRDADPDELLAAAEKLIGTDATVTSSSHHGLLEIGPAGVSKGSALADYADTLGIPAAAVAAVGDMPNDVPMLRWAGRGYAVGNAHPAARAAADEVLVSNDEDAVAQLIESILAAG